jgi:hypothetical protein
MSMRKDVFKAATERSYGDYTYEATGLLYFVLLERGGGKCKTLIRAEDDVLDFLGKLRKVVARRPHERAEAERQYQEVGPTAGCTDSTGTPNGSIRSPAMPNRTSNQRGSVNDSNAERKKRPDSVVTPFAGGEANRETPCTSMHLRKLGDVQYTIL